MSNQYIPEWVSLYKEFAKKLLVYKNNRKKLVEIIKEYFSSNEESLPTLDKDNNITDVDPFTVFALFNKSSQSKEKKLNILSFLVKKLDIKDKIPDDFSGIPVINNVVATFYRFYNEREENEIENLWKLFETALAYDFDQSEMNKKEVCKYFDIVVNIKGSGKSKITKALYWIAPNRFLNLDKRSEWYIYKAGGIPKEIVKKLPDTKVKITSEEYFAILEEIRDYCQSSQSKVKNFIELSTNALKESERVNQENKNILKTQNNEKGNALGDDNVETKHYWTYSPGRDALMWDKFYEEGIIGLEWEKIEDFSQYNSKDEVKIALRSTYDKNKSYKNIALAIWQFTNEMKEGDIIFAKSGANIILGRGVVESDYIYDPDRSGDFKNFRKVKWTHKGNWYCDDSVAYKTLTDVTNYTDFVDKLKNIVENDDDESEEEEYPVYTKTNFLEDVFLEEKEYEKLANLLRKKKNIILQGAPGVGKTFCAKRLAYSIIGNKNQEQVMMVQFHQNYSYEDFIEGFRPVLLAEKGHGFDIKKGAFYNFCKKANEDTENDYFFIIDEINRGNLSKIFGELFMLIETDKRGNSLQLLYSNEKFAVPQNLYIIGMMNTADRSLALLDYALRRRFAFYEMKPGFETTGFIHYKENLKNEKFEKLIKCVINLNEEIKRDYSLGDGFCIGHSYFSNLKKVDEEELEGIVEYEIIPLLKEYWFDEPTKVESWSKKLREAIR